MSKSTASLAYLMLLLLGLFFLGNLDVQVISPILPNLTDDFHITVFLAGISVTAYSVSGAIWALVIGPLSDRYGRVRFLRLAAVAFGLASGLAFAAEAFDLFIVARTLAGFAGGTFTACIIAQIADLFPYSRRGRAMGLVGAVYSLAAVLGVPAGAIVAADYGWRSLYLFFAVSGLLLAMLMSVKVQRLVAANEQPQPVANLNGPAQSRSVRAVVRDQILDYGRIWAAANTRNGLLLAIAMAATSTSLMTYLGAWLADDFGLRGSAMAAVFLAAGLSTVLGSLIGGYLGDRVGKRRLVMLSSVLVALVLLTPGLIGSLPGVYGFCIAGGLLMAMRQGPYEALLTELVPRHRRGAYVAMRSTTAKFAIGAAAAVAGYLYQTQGFTAVSAFASLTGLMAAAITHFTLRQIDPAFQDETDSDLAAPPGP